MISQTSTKNDQVQKRDVLHRLRKAVKDIIILFKITQTIKYSSSYESLKTALLKSQIFRNKDNELAIESYMRNLPFFKDLKEKYGYQVFKEFCGNLYFKICHRNDVIIHKGSYGEYFYILLKGAVNIVTYQPKNKEAQQQIILSQQALNEGVIFQVQYENEQLFEPLILTELNENSTFGDLALLQSNSVTTASVIAKYRCEFAIIDKDSFWKCLGKYKQNEYDSKVSLLRKIPFLSQWNEIDLKTISYEFQQKKFLLGQSIYQQGDKNLGMYFITEGEVTLKIFQENSSEENNFLMKKKISGKQMPVSVIGLYNIFGFEQDDIYLFSAITTSKILEVYFIPKIQLQKRLQWNNEAKLAFNLSQEIYAAWRDNRKYNLLSSQKKQFEKKSNSTMGRRLFDNQLKKPSLQNYIQLRKKERPQDSIISQFESDGKQILKSTEIFSANKKNQECQTNIQNSFFKPFNQTLENQKQKDKSKSFRKEPIQPAKHLFQNFSEIFNNQKIQESRPDIFANQTSSKITQIGVINIQNPQKIRQKQQNIISIQNRDYKKWKDYSFYYPKVNSTLMDDTYKKQTSQHNKKQEFPSSIINMSMGVFMNTFDSTEHLLPKIVKNMQKQNLNISTTNTLKQIVQSNTPRYIPSFVK